MRKRAFAIFLIGCVLVVFGGLWLSRTPPEPVYQGKRLSEWLWKSTYEKSALHNFDGTAIPWLLWAAEHGRQAKNDPDLQDEMRWWISQRTGWAPPPPPFYYDERARALWVLFLIGHKDERVIQFAKERLKQKDGWRAAKFLTEAGDEAWEYLLRLSEEGSPQERAHSLVWLDNRLQNTPEEKRSVRQQKAIPVILRAMRDDNASIRDAAALAYSNMPESPIRRQSHAEAFPILLGLLSDADVRWTSLLALQSMGSIASPATPKVIELLENTEPRVRTNAALTLGEIDKEHQLSKEALQKMADSTSAPMHCRTAAANALWKFGIRAALIDELIGKLETPDGPFTREAAANLARIGPKEPQIMREILRRLPNHTHGYVLFEGFPRNTAIPYLIEALADEDPKIRTAATMVLEYRFAVKIETALEKAALDSDEQIRAAAERALRKIREGP